MISPEELWLLLDRLRWEAFERGLPAEFRWGMLGIQVERDIEDLRWRVYGELRGLMR